MKKVVVLGGGSGTYTVLSGLKNYNIKLSSIVTMMDSGSSSGKLRDQYGVLPPGDLRQSLVALSNSSHVWRKLFLHRFETGDFKGHNFGNIFIAALENIENDYNEVVKLAELLLQTTGKVVPVTLDKAHLVVEFLDGKKIITEDSIDKSGYISSKISKAYLEPSAKANTLAVEAIKEADYLVIGPGDLYTSLIPNLLVSGIPEAINKSSCKIIFVVNLFTKNGQTTNYKASDHLADIEQYLKRPVDFCLINSGGIPKVVISHYNKDGEKPVIDDLPERRGLKILRADLISPKIITSSKADKAIRSIIRHDSGKLAKEIVGVFLEDSKGVKKLKDIISDAKSYIFD